MSVWRGWAAGIIDKIGWVQFIDMCNVGCALRGGGRSRQQGVRFVVRVCGWRDLDCNGVQIVLSQCTPHSREVLNHVSDSSSSRIPKWKGMRLYFMYCKRKKRFLCT